MNADGTTCKTCNSGYFIKEGKCTKNTIENCNIESTVGEVVKCKECASTFTVMEDGKCAKIEVEKCLVGVPNDTKKCTQCAD